MIHLTRAAVRRAWPQTLRGLVLWQFGWAFMVVGGINYIGTAVPEPTRTYLSFALALFPSVVYGWLFVVVGLLAVVLAYQPGNRDRLGFTLGAGLAAAWGLGYVCGFLFYDAPARALGGAVVWLLYAFLLTTCARIPRIVLSEVP